MLTALALSACGGGGGSGSGSSGGSGGSGAGATSYTISGTISGLSAAGLELQYYSGGQVLSVAAGSATFAFSQPVPSGTDVKMVVTAQPSWQTCTPGASNFSGPITQNITTDTLSCAAPTAAVSTFASGSDFSEPTGVAVDTSTGDIYVADTQDNQILMITSTGTVSVFAGNGTQGYVDNTSAADAEFNRPYGVAFYAGTVYVADTGNNVIRMISSGEVSTLAGASASFNTPQGLAVDSEGNIYVADSGNNEIREVTSSGVVTTFAGSGATGNSDGSSASTATFNFPQGVAVDSSGNVYVADSDNQEIRVISDGQVSLLAGAGPSNAGNVNGTGAAAEFSGPVAVAVDSAGNVYVADSNNNEIRLVAPNGLVSTLAGSGPTDTAQFDSPSGVALDASGNIYVANFGNNKLLELAPGS